MSQSLTSDGLPGFAPSPAPPELRRRIGWICHALRIAALVWIGWIVLMILVVWSDKTAVLSAYQRWLLVDLAGVSNASYAAALAVLFVNCAAAAAVAWCIWRLFGTYLQGRVFTVDAALWLRRTGLAGVAAVVVNLLARIVIVAIFTGQLILLPPQGSIVLPQDLLHLIFSLFLLALAHIFKAAAEMAADHAQIV